MYVFAALLFVNGAAQVGIHNRVDLGFANSTVEICQQQKSSNNIQLYI